MNYINVSGLLMENLELSANFQWAVLEAETKDVYQVNNHQLEPLPNVDTSLEDKRFSFQFKLRYKMGAYSDIYLVYGRGGVDASQRHDIGSESWFRSLDNMWQQPSNSLLTAKIRYLF